MNNWNIVFLHGLESGIHGRKVKYLQKHFKNVIVPDFQVGVWSWSQKNSFLRNYGSIQKSLDNSIEIAASDINKTTALDPSKKLFIIGSSWGGLVGLKLLEKETNIIPDKVLLLAPALVPKSNALFRYIFRFPGNAIPENLNPNLKINILHGDDDQVIDIEGSRILSQKFPGNINFTEIPGADHPLNYSLGIMEGPPGSLYKPLSEIVTEMAQN